MSVASTITALETRRDAIIVELGNLATMGPNFGLDGVTIDWLAYGKALREELLEVTKTIEMLSGPCVVTSIGR